MFHIERSAKHHMVAFGGAPGDIGKPTSLETIQTIEDYKGLLAESMGFLHEAVLGDSTPEEKSFAMCHAVWSIASMGVAYGLPMNSLWQEYNRAVMTLIDPRTGKGIMKDGQVVVPEGHRDMNLLEVLIKAGMPAPVETFQQLGLIEQSDATANQ